MDYFMLATTGICFLLGVGNRLVMATAFLGILVFHLPASRRKIENAEYALDEAKLEEERKLRQAASDEQFFETDSALRIPVLTQPKDYAGTIGENAYFCLVAEGTNLHYRWQVSHDDGKTWWDMPVSQGGQTAELRVPIKGEYDGYLYHCVVWDDNGKSEISNTARLAVNK